MNDPIRPIDQSRACQLALASMKGDDSDVARILDEAHADGGIQRVLAAAVRSWVMTSVHYAGEHRTREALQAAIFDADLANQ